MIVLSVLAAFACILLWSWLNPSILIYTHFREPLPMLSFSSESFTIVQFADLHFGENDMKDLNSTELMHKILLTESDVDLVVFSGDQVTGDSITGVGRLGEKWVEALSVMGEFNIPFVSVFGNHDDLPYNFVPFRVYLWMLYLTPCLLVVLVISTSFSFVFNQIRIIIAPMALLLAVMVAVCLITSPSTRIRHFLHKLESNKYPRLSYSSIDDFDTNNFLLPLKSNGTVVFNLLFLDSGGGRMPYDVSGTYRDWIGNNQGGMLDKDFISFFHVPTPEFKDIRVKGDCFGELNTEPNHENFNHVLVKLKDTGIRAAFVGHDHGNDWCCRAGSGWPSLCYGKHTGYGGYGEWMRGARVIKLELDGNGQIKIETWVHMSNGSKINRGWI